MGCVIGIQFAELQLSFQSAVATLFQPEENEGATHTEKLPWYSWPSHIVTHIVFTKHR